MYGDYGANTGPIEVASLDLTTQIFGASERTLHTEETWTARLFDGHLYLPYLDPQGTNADPSQGQYAVASAAGSWTVVTSVIGVTHAFDFAETIDGLWVFGANEAEGSAVIYRSTDNGATWAESFTVHDASTVGTDGPRFYAVAQFGDELTAYCTPFGVGDCTAYRWDGATWNLLDPYPFINAGQTVRITDTSDQFSRVDQTFRIALPAAKDEARVTPDQLFVVVPASGDAQAVMNSLPAAFRNVSTLVLGAAVAGDHLWLLASDFHVWRGDRFGGWVDLLIVDDPLIRSLAVDTDGGYLYFGDTAGNILRTPIS